jgi:hypothetical protein
LGPRQAAVRVEPGHAQDRADSMIVKLLILAENASITDRARTGPP